MNYQDFHRAIHWLQEASGKEFPGKVRPGARGRTGTRGSNPETVFVGPDYVHIAANKATWDAYEWNPPQYRKAGAISTWHPWSRDSVPVKVTAEPEPVVSALNPNSVVQFAYKVADRKPKVPDSPTDEVYDFRWYLVPAPPGIPTGWETEWPGEPCWMIQRWVSWVPAGLAVSADPEAMEKPAWKDLQDTVALLNIQDEYYQVRRAHDHATEADEVKRRITDKSLITHLAGETYVGAGLDHMTGLVQMAERATHGGQIMPPIVLRDADHNQKTLFLQSELYDLLDKVTDRENVVESSHNRVIKQIEDKWKEAEDETRQWADRLDSMNDYADLVENYETLLAAEMKKYDPDALPADLPTLRGVLIERLEAKALGTIRDFARSLTQQGVIAGAACDDEADAILAVKRKARQGATHIWNAETTAEAKAAHKTAVEAIEAVTQLNVPAWQVNGTAAAQDGQTANFSASTSDLSLTVRPVNPSGTDAEGPLGIYPDWEYRDAHGDWVDVTTTRTPNPIKIQFAVPKDTDLPMTATVRARNDCGDSTLVLTIEPKE